VTTKSPYITKTKTKKHWWLPSALPLDYEELKDPMASRSPYIQRWKKKTWGPPSAIFIENEK